MGSAHHVCDGSGEALRLITGIEAVFELGQVAVQVLDGEAVEAANDATL